MPTEDKAARARLSKQIEEAKSKLARTDWHDVEKTDQAKTAAIKLFLKNEGINAQVTRGKGIASMWITIKAIPKQGEDPQNAQFDVAQVLGGRIPFNRSDPDAKGSQPGWLTRAVKANSMKTITLTPTESDRLIQSFKVPGQVSALQDLVNRSMGPRSWGAPGTPRKPITLGYYGSPDRKDPRIKGIKPPKKIKPKPKKSDFDRQISNLFDGDKRKPRNKFR